MRSALNVAAPTVAALTANDTRWTTRQVVEVVSVGASTSLVGIGSSAFVGDLGITGLEVPSAAATNRYLFRLGAIEIPKESGLILLAIRQLALIGMSKATEAPSQGKGDVLIQLPVTTPTWTFVDGNISWHVRWQPNRFSSDNPTNNAAEGLGILAYDTGYDGTDAALLYRPSPAGLFTPYNPPSPNVPGVAVGSLGTVRDMRYRWDSTDWTLNTFMKGPGVLAFYASVKQTNPQTRLRLPTFNDTQLQALCPEDRFVASFEANNAVTYTRIAGSMVVELIPDSSRNVEQGTAMTPLDYYAKYPEPQRPHGDTASLTSLTSPKLRKV